MGQRHAIPHRTEQLDTGTIIVHVDADNSRERRTVAIYSRVSSAENKDNLDRQADRLIQYAVAKGYQIVKVVKEVGSGLNDNRKKLERLLTQPDYDILLVEHRDRLARFGTNYMRVLLERSGVHLEVVNLAENGDELMQDLVAIVTSFSARLYGQRRSKRKTEQIIASLSSKDENQCTR